MQAAGKLFWIATASFILLLGVLPIGTGLPQLEGAEPAPPAKGDESQAVLTGKIVDEAKKPVAGATVTALHWKKSQPVKSAADGSFRLPLGEPRPEELYAGLLVQGPNGELGFLVVQQSKPAPVEVVVKAPQEVTVRVTAGDGKPVSGADVYVQAAYSQIAEGRTDTAGQWTGRVPVDAANADTWGVLALKGKVGFDYVVAKRQPDEKQPKDRLPNQLNLKLDGARTLRVKTVDAEGKPIAGVKVGPWEIRKPDPKGRVSLASMEDVYQTTGNDGVAVFDWLPERFMRELPILVHSEDYYAVAGYDLSITEEKPATELTIALLPLERLSGRVTHADGKPAAGIRVQAAGQGTGHNPFHGTTQTDADGRYAFKGYSEQAYILAVGNERWAAPYRSVVLRAGKPVTAVDFVLGPATRVHGRVTLGKEDRAVSKVRVTARTKMRQIPPELRKKDDHLYHAVWINFSAHTDKDGRFELFLGPGEYELGGPVRTDMVKLTIPAQNPPREIVQDFRMPRPETGPLAGRVVDEKGRPIVQAVINGDYASAEARRHFRDLKTDADGKFQVERSLDPLVLHARTPDKMVAGIAHLDAESTTVEIVCRPVTAASGRLLDLENKPVAQAKLLYGIRIYMGKPEISPWHDAYGGTAVTDEEGRFTLDGLVAGEKYWVSVRIDASSSRHVTTLTPKDTKPMALGDLRVDPKPNEPYVPPTPTEVTAKAFVTSKPASPLARKDKMLSEAKLAYTRPLLLFGRPKDAACIDLFRLFSERADDADREEERKPLPTPRRLRWEYELLSLDIEQPEVRQLAEKLGVELGKDRSPVLAVLNGEGTLAATYALSLGAKQQLDAKALTEFLVKNKPATRNAERMLAEALKQAKAEDKRVFFIASASWCGPCRALSRFLDSWKTELNRHYVFVKLDVSRDEHAQTVTQRFQGNSDGGVPWYAILDGDGKVLITSTAPAIEREGGPARPENIGFPSEAAEVEHFLKMLSQTAPRLDRGKLAEIRETLLKKQ